MSCGEVGSFKRADIDHGERLTRWVSDVDGLVSSWNPNLIIWDQPFARGAEGAVVVAMGGLLEMLCWDRDIKRLIAPMNTVKKTILGNGRATNTDAVAWAKAQGWRVTCHHEADAVLLLSYGLEQRAVA